MIFVFGSNLAGRHGAGAALYARNHHGAIYGLASGMQGNSYGIPTKDQYLKTLPIKVIRLYVTQFLEYARENQHKTFQVTAIGCGFAGYQPTDIAPLFRGYPENCILPKEFLDVLSEDIPF